MWTRIRCIYVDLGPGEEHNFLLFGVSAHACEDLHVHVSIFVVSASRVSLSIFPVGTDSWIVVCVVHAGVPPVLLAAVLKFSHKISEIRV